MSSCDEIQGLIAALDDEIHEADLEGLLVHVGECGSCRAQYERACRLGDDMRSLAQCADRIAAGPQVYRAWRLVSASRIAAAIFVAVTLVLAARFFRQPPDMPQQALVQAPIHEDRPVMQVADASEILLAHPSHEMAVQFESKRSDVRIVWLYSPIPEKANAAPTTAPQS